MYSPRLAAAFMLRDILEKKLFLSDVRHYVDSLEGQDKAFTNMLVLTSLRRLSFTQKMLKHRIKKKLPAKAQIAEYLLILATTEILYLDTPDYAAINTYVELVKKQTDKYIAGFANAVLHKICNEKESLPPQNGESFFPDNFFRILRQSYSTKTIRKIEQSALLEPPLDISLKSDSAIKPEGKKLPGGTIRVYGDLPVPELAGFSEGDWWVQDFAASLAVKTLLPETKGCRILDLCAAPGGKTAQLLAAKACVDALDISPLRLQTLQENLKRLHLNANKIICANALDYLKNFAEEPYDDILLDAPCSATGTLRRHPEIIHIKTEQDIERQTALQKKILAHITPALKIGGRLVYCTCSLDKREGEAQIADFLSSNSHFKVLPLKTKLPYLPDEFFTESGFIRTLPHYLKEEGGTDGFFIALLQRIK